jgi:UDP-glucose 4-epimerase
MNFGNQMKLKALVTGGAGFIGSNLVDTLLEQNFDVTVIDNESSEAHDYFYWNKNAHNHDVDIRNPETRSLYDGIDFVFHVAAEARIQPAIQNPTNAVSINAYGTCCVLQWAREAGVKRVIYSSTSSAYGRHTPPHHESMPVDCLNPYSVSKVAGEELCRMYTALFGLRTISLRYFNVYGPRQPLRGDYAPVVGLFLRQLENKKPLTVVGDGQQRRDFTHVSDVVQANILAATVDVPGNGFGKVYNVGTGTNHSIIQLAKMISDNIEYIDPRPGEADATSADNAAIRKWLGWKPRVKLEDWLLNELEYYR